MGKEKGKKGVANKHLHARITYLEKAAKYLTERAQTASNIQDASNAPGIEPTGTQGAESMGLDRSEGVAAVSKRLKDQAVDSKGSLPFNHQTAGGLPTLYTSQLCSIARKGQIRLSQDIKHSICKTCSAPLVDGTTSSRFTENLSKGGGRPWAEVLVVECNACGTVKRFPVGARRQRKKKEREAGMGTYRDDGSSETAIKNADEVAGGAMEAAVPPVGDGG